MTNEIARSISERIITTFSSEAIGTYFIEGKKKIYTKDKKSVPARGKLWSCWRNRKYTSSKLQKKSTLKDHDSSRDSSSGKLHK